MQIIISTLVVFPAGYMSVSNYSPRQSPRLWGCECVFEGMERFPGREFVVVPATDYIFSIIG